MTAPASIEGLEMALRDYLSVVLERQDRTNSVLADVKAQNAAILAALTELAANGKAVIALDAVAADIQEGINAALKKASHDAEGEPIP